MNRAVWIAAVLLLGSSPAFGHGLGVDAKIVDGELKIEVYFDDDTPADHASLTLTCESGSFAPIAGKTDASGRWVVSLRSLPTSGKYKLVVDAGDGHAVTKVLTIPERAANETRLAESDQREEFTGNARFISLAAGVVVILGGTILWTRIRKRAGGA